MLLAGCSTHDRCVASHAVDSLRSWPPVPSCRSNRTSLRRSSLAGFGPVLPTSSSTPPRARRLRWRCREGFGTHPWRIEASGVSHRRLPGVSPPARVTDKKKARDQGWWRACVRASRPSCGLDIAFSARGDGFPGLSSSAQWCGRFCASMTQCRSPLMSRS